MIRAYTYCRLLREALRKLLRFSEKHVRVFEKTYMFPRKHVHVFSRSDSPIYSITCQHIMFKSKLLLFFVALLFYGLNLLDTFLDIRMAHEKVPQQIGNAVFSIITVTGA